MLNTLDRNDAYNENAPIMCPQNGFESSSLQDWSTPSIVEESSVKFNNSGIIEEYNESYLNNFSNMTYKV